MSRLQEILREKEKIQLMQITDQKSLKEEALKK